MIPASERCARMAWQVTAWRVWLVSNDRVSAGVGPKVDWQTDASRRGTSARPRTLCRMGPFAAKRSLGKITRWILVAYTGVTADGGGSGGSSGWPQAVAGPTSCARAASPCPAGRTPQHHDALEPALEGDRRLASPPRRPTALRRRADGDRCARRHVSRCRRADLGVGALWDPTVAKIGRGNPVGPTERALTRSLSGRITR